MNIVGVDIGTGNLVAAKQLKDGKIEVNAMRDMYLPVSPEDLAASEIANTQLDYVEVYDGDDLETIAIVGEDSFRFANIFGQDIRRPMQKGVISTQDIDALDIIALMIEKLVGRADSDGGFCVYSVPAQAVDAKIPPIAYHEAVFGKVFKALGYESRSMNEGMAVIYSECADESYSGIGISVGAGLTNVACSYKGTPTLTFSVSRGGDWIDQMVADSIGKLPTRITAVKEKDTFDLANPRTGKKQERRVKESLAIYYENLINYVLKVFMKKFETAAEGLDIDEKIPIIISGGTSKAKGFKELFEKVFEKYREDFPYEVSEIRVAKDQLSAVALGNLVYGLWDRKENDENITKEASDVKQKRQKSND